MRTQKMKCHHLFLLFRVSTFLLWPHHSKWAGYKASPLSITSRTYALYVQNMVVVLYLLKIFVYCIHFYIYEVYNHKYMSVCLYVCYMVVFYCKLQIWATDMFALLE